MKWNEEEDEKKPLSLLYKSIRLYLSHSLSLSLCFLCSYSFIFMHTHTQNTRQKVCPSVSEERVVLLFWKMSLQIRVKKMQKSFCSSSFKRVFSSSVHSEKKDLLFLCFFPLCVLSGPRKKKSFRRWDELSSLLTFYKTSSRWQPLLWQRQRSGAKSLLQTGYDSWAPRVV